MLAPSGGKLPRPATSVHLVLELHLVLMTLLFLLVLHVLPDHLLIQTYRVDTVTSCPKMIPFGTHTMWYLQCQIACDNFRNRLIGSSFLTVAEQLRV